MSQSGFQPILIYASGTSGNTPAAANLQSTTNGAELAINYVDGKLFYKDGSGVVQTIASQRSANGNITWGAANQIPYQTAANTTAFIAAPTVANTVLQWTSNGFNWVTGGGGGGGGGTTVTINNDTSNTSFLYPLFANATTGTVSSVYTSNTSLQYKPSTGEFGASELIATNGIILNSNTVSSTYTIQPGYSASSVGPISIANNQSVTVGSTSRWVIL
jgi:hypothetical protein